MEDCYAKEEAKPVWQQRQQRKEDRTEDIAAEDTEDAKYAEDAIWPQVEGAGPFYVDLNFVIACKCLVCKCSVGLCKFNETVKQVGVLEYSA